MDQPLTENVPDLIEIKWGFVESGDQFRLLIAPCRDLYGMTHRGLIGQGVETAGRRFPENRPGSLSAPHINGVKNNNK